MEKLRHGRFLTGKNFPRFVETWNEIVDFISNLCGDGDGVGTGQIKVDKSAKGHPIIRFKNLGIGGGGGSSYTPNPSPFDINTVDGVMTVVRGVFYWDGVQKTVSDYAIPSGAASIYLIATQDGGESSGEPSWTFSLSNTAPSQSGSTRALGYKLYDLTWESSNITNVTDYRTTFLEIPSPHKVRYFKVEKTGGTSSDPQLSLDASGDYADFLVKKGDFRCTGSAGSSSASLGAWKYSNPGRNASLYAGNSSAEISAVDGQKRISLSTSDISHGTNVSLHTLTVHKADGTNENYDVLANDDIDIYSGSGTVLKNVVLEYNNPYFTITKTFINLKTGAETTEGPTTVFTTTPLSSEPERSNS